jgi:hypothetical protein
MLVSSSQASPLIPAVEQSGDAGEQERLRAGLASRVLSGPGLWTGWLDELDRRGLLEGLLADGVIDEAIASAPHDHQLDRSRRQISRGETNLSEVKGSATGPGTRTSACWYSSTVTLQPSVFLRHLVR